jgi:hypothetical protein
MTGSLRHPWVRLTRPLDVESARDRDWAESGRSRQEPGVVPLSARRDVPVIVVVGERGVGKSAVLKTEREDLESAGVVPVHVDLAAVSSEKARRDVCAALSPPVGSVRHVLIDGIDEALPAAEIDRVIVEALEELDHDSRQLLRLRISCRTSRRSPLLEDGLRRLWQVEPLVVNVASLTRDDVLVAAKAYGLDAEQFVRSLGRRQLLALASWPVTLIPLLEAARDGSPLPDDAMKAYQQACRRLCTERERTSLTDGRDRSFETGELIALARKAAAAVQFCAREGLAERDDVSDCVTFAELAQGFEPLDGGGTVQCTDAAYRALTQAGILVATGERRWGFAHRSFQEFLASEYLRVHKVERTVRDELLLVGDGATRQVASGHRETAAWLALSDGELFEQMLRADPRHLLLTDLSVLSHEDRARVFDALLALIRAGVAPVIDWQALGRLDSDLIVGRLTPLLRVDSPWEEVHFALSVANACRREGLIDLLLDLAEDEQVPELLRALALNAMVDSLQEGHVARLRQLVADPQPDVAAHAIDLLWPTHLSAEELLANLPAPPSHRSGRAQSLLKRLPAMLGHDQPLKAVRWARQVLGGGASGNERRPSAVAKAATAVLAQAVAELAATGVGEPSIVGAIAEALIAMVDGPFQHTEHTQSETLREALAGSPSVRRAVARAVLERADIEQIHQFCGAWSQVVLFDGEADSGYWAVQWPTLSLADRARMHEPLSYPPTNEQEWSDAYRAQEKHSDLREIIGPWFVCPNPPENNGLRNGYYHQLELARAQQARRDALRYDETLLREAIDAVLAGTGDIRRSWRAALGHLYRTTDSQDPIDLDRLDVSDAPQFPTGDSPLSGLLRRAALTVLCTAPVIEIEHLDPHGIIPRRHAPELCALALLVRANHPLPALAEERWTGLAIALFASSGGWMERELREQLLERCIAASDSGFERALPRLLDRLNEYGLARAVERLPRTLEAAHDCALLDWAAANQRGVRSWALVLGALSRNGNEHARGLLRRAVAVAPSRLSGRPESLPVRRWLEAADLLTQLGDAQSWTKTLDILAREPRLATPMVKRFVQSDSIGPWPLEPHQISTGDLARLYIIMADHVPMPDDFDDTSNVFSDRDEDLLRLHQALPWAIRSRGGTSGLDTLRSLAQQYPDSRQLRVHAAELALHVADQSWRPPATVEQLVKITSGRLSRVVHDEFQLREVILEALQRLQDRLQGDNGWVTALWNQEKNKAPAAGARTHEATLWWPTWENDLSDFVTTFLRYDLADRAVVVNREVEITRPGLNGGRTDIHIQAAPEASGGSEQLTVIIETKGCWNDSLDRGLADQLVDKYLFGRRRRTGIYLIGYFDDGAWPKGSGGQHGRMHTPHTPEQILTRQQAIAEHEAHEKQVSVIPFVLDCRLPRERLRRRTA